MRCSFWSEPADSLLPRNSPPSPRIRNRRRAGIASRADHAGAELRALAGSRLQWALAAILRVGVGPSRAREHHGARILFAGHRRLRAVLVCRPPDAVRAVLSIRVF